MTENIEIDPNPSPHTTIDSMYEWGTSEFGKPINFFIFDKRFTINYTFLIDELFRNPECQANEADVKRYMESGLLPEQRLGDGSIGFPHYTYARLRFLKELENKWGYDLIKLKTIADYEEMLIDNVYTAEKLDYSDLPTLDFFIASIKDRIDAEKEMLEYCEPHDKKEHLLNWIAKTENTIIFLQDKRFEDLPEITQKSIDKAVFGIKWAYEFSRLVGISEYQSKILCGFSPNASIHSFTSRSRKLNEPSDDESKYHYSYYDKNLKRVYRWGDWGYHNPTRLGFFATPDFLIDIQGDKIHIAIRSPHKVDARYMRKIEKLYGEFRNILEVPKAGWGEKTGKKGIISQRNARLKELYRISRKEKPHTAASHLLKLAMLEVKSEFGEELSTETAKRIIYTKENITNSSAND